MQFSHKIKNLIFYLNFNLSWLPLQIRFIGRNKVQKYALTRVFRSSITSRVLSRMRLYATSLGLIARADYSELDAFVNNLNWGVYRAVRYREQEKQQSACLNNYISLDLINTHALRAFERVIVPGITEGAIVNWKCLFSLNKL